MLSDFLFDRVRNRRITEKCKLYGECSKMVEEYMFFLVGLDFSQGSYGFAELIHA